jgi:hypothetical protein
MSYTYGSYITNAEYATATGRSSSEATAARIKRASQLFDVRVGETDITELTTTTRQDDAIKEWVSWMIVYLVDHNDAPEVVRSFKLGRYSQDVGKMQGPNFDSLFFSDTILKKSGLINRKIHYKAGAYWNSVEQSDFTDV